MLMDPNAAAVGIAFRLTEEFFPVDKRNLLVFQAMETLARAKTPIDVQGVAERTE
jgi:replicative DNA helicase